MQAIKKIIAIAKHETGNFTSKIFRENNNLFGMKQAKTRENTAIGTNHGHAVYCCINDSLIDFLLWFKYHGFDFDNFDKFTIDELIEYMKKRGYMQADLNEYINGVKRFMQ